MKKFLFILPILFIYSVVLSQPMITYTWDTYQTKFDIASDMDVTDNTADKFNATNSDVTLTIYPRKGEYMRFSEMKNALSIWAKENSVTDWDNIYEISRAELNGYEGVFLDGMVSGFPVFASIIVHPDYPSNSQYVWISYRESAKSTAKRILYSFTPTY